MSNKSVDHPEQVRGNECNVLFPRNEEGKVNIKRGVYEQIINQREQPLSTSKREDSVLEWIR